MKVKQILDKIENTNVDKGMPAPAFATELNSNADVVGNLNSNFLYDQSKPENNGLAKGASMNNKYLDKIASTVPQPPHLLHKVGIGLSAAGLGLSVANTYTNTRNAKREMERSNIEERSLKALHGINKSLSTAVIAPSPLPIKKLY